MSNAPALQSFDTKKVLDGEAFVEVEGRPVLGIGLTALFLFREGLTPACRDAVAAISDEYFATAKEQLKWQVLDDDRWIDLKTSPVQPLRASEHYSELRGPVNVSFYSREQAEDAGACTFCSRRARSPTSATANTPPARSCTGKSRGRSSRCG